MGEFALELQKFGIGFYATDSTGAYLETHGINVRRISDITGFSNLLDGRVKTLHPSIFASILAVRGDPEHMKQLSSLNMPPIDIVVSDLYPFESAVREPNRRLEHMLENIDIGGVSLIRAAAKNFQNVAVVTEKRQFKEVVQDLEKNGGSFSDHLLRELCISAYRKTAYYDSVIAEALSGMLGIDGFPERLTLNGALKTGLKYGENPYQRAASYTKWNSGDDSILSAEIDGGKELSYNNLLDVNMAVELISGFSLPGAVVVKHANPCGVATADDAFKALSSAFETDTLSAYGSVIAVNRNLNAESASYLSGKFVEVIVAPGYDTEALGILRKKKKLRIITYRGKPAREGSNFDVRRVIGGYLVQSVETPEVLNSDLKIVTKRAPTDEEMAGLLFATRIVRFLWSNAIVLASGTKTVGIGAGQSSRVDAVKIAVSKSCGKSRGSVMGSDAYFPFRDGIDEAANGGVTAVMQPGGSIRDAEVIRAADENDMAMVFTGIRLFRH
ncbi:MAG: bifunctional phosphoribosylaminoimidazolecarboxamide formyltransferase/IMP cyclohydrolase [Thermoplasmata archaeon]|nr:bifunctional phosphoribosylaminoimidazolecarboxamide formyltransferase/IMP cyclohydrolase [Candidatus Sysuiplasma acidicola]MBX8636977.1 bifunctional phosphoribosylaminoimidazolecarboxamide formyltransferase/IMP cyclohydrolase [Candidatus Sysuiplasma acidicola]MBX8645332.1 bifunctional phosphoribosylaminoimidazolecarboxamide formyltransferase/IMP cyclohydrolase [Candidatus Sysuiplasma acidicola]